MNLYLLNIIVRIHPYSIIGALFSGHAAARDNADSGADRSRQASQNCAPHAVAIPQSNLLCRHLALRAVGRHALPYLHHLLGFRGESNVPHSSLPQP